MGSGEAILRRMTFPVAAVKPPRATDGPRA